MLCIFVSSANQNNQGVSTIGGHGSGATSPHLRAGHWLQLIFLLTVRWRMSLRASELHYSLSISECTPPLQGQPRVRPGTATVDWVPQRHLQDPPALPPCPSRPCASMHTASRRSCCSQKMARIEALLHTPEKGFGRPSSAATSASSTPRSSKLRNNRSASSILYRSPMSLITAIRRRRRRRSS